MANIVLRGKLEASKALLVQVISLGVFLFGWWLVTDLFHLVRSGILPSPIRIITAFPDLFFQGDFWKNLSYSLFLTLLSGAEAVCIAIPLGFAIGLVPTMRAVFEKPLAAMRYLPLTALIGLFLLWFGIRTNMKIQFLTLCSLVYLVPAVVQRIDEVSQVYLDTFKTLGANNWQTVRKIYLPAVLAPFSDDARVLMPIGWTYIIIAEIINLGDGGVGAMIFSATRRSRLDEVFALLLIIVFVGFVEDKLFVKADKFVFPHKHLNGKG